jgi:2-polyprenyl-3-methyl-5-hydroxy-6-metoxy-1,4-benzoquinol methylase
MFRYIQVRYSLRMDDESRPQYDMLSEDYHWLYSDSVLGGKRYIEENGEVLAEAGLKAHILDCSCGIGTLAIPLAKLGYEVSGSDASQGMIEKAKLAAGSADLDIPLICCRWEDLPVHFPDRFDLIFCLGNSIGHARNREEMLRSLKGMRAVLTNGGRLVIQSLNWEQVRKEKKRFTPYPWRDRGGQRCLPLYVWTFPERFDDVHTIDVVFVFDSGESASIRSYPIVYHPYHIEDLIERLRCAGFTEIRNTFRESAPGYRVIAS